MSQENNFIPNQKEYCKLRPFPLFVKNNFPFIENTFESLDIYGLLCKVVEFLNDVIKNENIVTENQQALYDAFVELNTYVSNYFDNLDVQEEINNKLDEMVESGVFENILTDYLKLVKIINTCEDLKLDTTLLNGQKVMTMGYHNINDGGKAYYYITNTVTGITKHYETLQNNLYAVLIYQDELNLAQLGLSETNTASENTSIITHAFGLMKNGGTIKAPIGTFEINKIEIDFACNNLIFESFGNFGTVFNNSNLNDFLFQFNNNMRNFKMKNIALYCNEIASGISFKKPTSGFHMQLNLENVTVYNGHKCFEFLNCLYLYAKRIGGSLPESTYQDDFAVYLNGYEYNWFLESSFQINEFLDSNTNQNNDLFIIEDTQHTYIENCEFAKTHGSAIKIINNLISCNNINITDSILYRVHYGINIYSPNRGSNDIKMNNISCWLLGLNSNESAINVENNNTNNKIQFNCKQLTVHRVQNVSGKIITASDNTLNGCSIDFTNLYNSQPSLEINNNTFDNIESNLANGWGTGTITADGTTTVFNVLFNYGQQPHIVNKIPKIEVNFPELFNANYYTRPSWYDPSNRLRCGIEFTTPPAAGTYTYTYRIIY